MVRLVRRAGVLVTLLALGAVTALGGPASAARGGTASASGGGLQVVASGLDNPRGIAIGPGGALFVAESGAGGSGPCTVGPEGNEVCFGPSGAITRVAHGIKRRVVTGLPSVADKADGSAAIGPVDVSFAGGRQYVLLGTRAAARRPASSSAPAPPTSAGCCASRVARSSGWRTSRSSRPTTTPTAAPAPSPAWRSTATQTGSWPATGRGW